MSEVAVVGAGYVGLTTAACFARLGHDVRCADIDADRVARLSKGEIPILEEGMPGLVAEGLSIQRLRFVVGAAEAIRGAEFVFLCVGTPPGDDGSADLSAIEAVARDIAPLLEPGAVVVNKSTVPVGTTRLVARWLAEAGATHDTQVASNPEFLREGNAVRDFLQPQRIVIGCDDPAVAVRISELYRSVPAPIVVTDAASAEMIKQASNAFLATKISFINAVANVCEAVNADVRDVALGMGYDPRIGSDFLHPGPGFGGACLPKDTSALLRTAEEYGYDFSLLRGVLEVNERQRDHIVDQIRAMAGGALAGTHIAVLGLTFKANTDDLRDSPALSIAAELVAAGATVCAFDPVAGEAAGHEVPGLVVAADAYDACDGAEVLALLTEWDQFRWLDYSRVAAAMAEPRVVDARNLLDPAAMRRLGFAYQGVGR
ncbi:MAG: UDP-glucose/GDP-mannose dehydrogenase family protein [Acidimicrobiia bacterium]|jgi:UDPglucose 6-dehydrogenase